MNVFGLFFSEMAKLVAKKGVLLSVIAALLVPVVYGGILLSPKWGPYDNLSNLPVAVVNNDVGAESDGEQINVGKDLVADLEQNKSLGWKFVDSAQAKQGLKDLKYYMVIEIPEDFSERVTTVLDPDPMKLELNYIQNEGLNFMAAQVTKSATEKIRESLANKITEKYVKNIFTNLGDVAAGFQTAADGSAQLHDGTVQLNDGTSTLLKSLTEKSGDITKLADGSSELRKGTGQLLSNLTKKQPDITKLAMGTKELKNGQAQILTSLQAKAGDIAKLAKGTRDLKDGSSELKDGTSLMLSQMETKAGDITKLALGATAANNGTGLLLQSLKEKQQGIQDLAAGAKQLEASTPLLKGGTEQILGGLTKTQTAIRSKIQPGATAVSAGVNEVAASSQALGSNLQQLTGALDAYLAAHPELQTDTAFMTIVQTSRGITAAATDPVKKEKLQQLQGGAALLAAAFTENSVPKDDSLADGVNQMVAGQTEIVQGVASLHQKAPLLAGGTATVEAGWQTMIDKVTELHGGTTLIAAGNNSVNTGWSTLTDGVKKLNGGAGAIQAGLVQVSAGNDSVNTAWAPLTNGVGKVHAGLVQVSDGNATVDNGWRQLTSGASKIHNGMVQVSDGTASVNKGWGDLTDGVTQLNDGAGKLNVGSNELATGLKEGAEKTSAIKADDSNISMFSSPVELVPDKVNGYQFYRDSTAPYVLSLALLVGILIMSMFINFKQPEGVSALAWFGAKFLNLAALAIGQALLLSITVLLFLGLNVQNSFGFVFFAIMVSIVFAGIVLFFASLGNVGRFIAFALIILQLSTTGANLPIPMLPDYLRTLSEFLPLTYSIAGFKSVISIDNFGESLANLSVLFIYFIAFVLLALAVFTAKDKTKSKSHSSDLAV